VGATEQRADPAEGLGRRERADEMILRPAAGTRTRVGESLAVDDEQRRRVDPARPRRPAQIVPVAVGGIGRRA
jgi:hypothetical protein